MSLINDEARREKLARMARARAMEFSPQKMTRGYLELYRALLSQRRITF